MSPVKHRRSSSFEEWIPIFNTSGSFLVNFILYIYIYYKNICTIYIYTYIVYIILHRAKYFFLNVIVRPGIREQTCILIKEKRKRIEKEKRSKVCYYFKKERIKSHLCCKKKINIVCFFASQTIADHNVNLAYVRILKNYPKKKKRNLQNSITNPF